MAHKVTDTDLKAFCADQLGRHEAYRKRMGFQAPIHDEQFLATKGPKFARIVAQRTDDSRRVVCFINLENGDIHKADGWKKPCTTGATKGVRGNIFDGVRGAGCMTWHGTAYLK